MGSNGFAGSDLLFLGSLGMSGCYGSIGLDLEGRSATVEAQIAQESVQWRGHGLVARLRSLWLQRWTTMVLIMMVSMNAGL